MGTFQLDDETLARFLALRDDAIRHALKASEAAHPEVFARFGEKGRLACAEDLGFHLDFLRPVLETGDLSPFIAYLGWLAQVLESRGVPVASLPQSLVDLGAFFKTALGAAGLPVNAALQAGIQALESGLQAPGYDRPCPEAWAESEAFLTAALAGKQREAGALFNSTLDRESSMSKSAIHVIQPALYGVGRKWQQNQVSVAQEHLATAISTTLMAQAYGHFEPAPDNGLRALFACPPGNSHSVGLRMVADSFEFEGWETRYLGANTPANALLEQVRSFRPHLVGLSASLPQQLRALRETIATLRAGCGDDCPRITVGGLVINQFPDLARSIGAEVLGADACSAAAAARAFTDETR